MNEIISSAVLPPVLFVYLAVLALLFRRHILGRGVAYLMLLCLLAASLPATSKLLARPLLHDQPDAATLSSFAPDVILVPTGGIYADPSGGLHPNAETLKRVALARRLQGRLRLPMILSGGDPDELGTSEAEVARRTFAPAAPVLLDTAAIDTSENAADFALLMKKNGFNRPLLVTSDSHMQRMYASLRPYGFATLTYPVPGWVSGDYEPGDFLPGNRGLNRFYRVSRLYAGLVYYALDDRISFADMLAPGHIGQ